MRIKALIGIATLSATLVLTACSSQNDAPATKPATASASAQAEATASTSSSGLTGTFTGLNDKTVAGTVTVSGDTLTLSGFSSDEGPDLHLYFTNGTDEAAVTAGVELGGVDFAKASQTFMLKDVKASGYTNVVVHCDKARAVFGAAKLS